MLGILRFVHLSSPVISSGSPSPSEPMKTKASRDAERRAGVAVGEKSDTDVGWREVATKGLWESGPERHRSMKSDTLGDRVRLIKGAFIMLQRKGLATSTRERQR